MDTEHSYYARVLDEVERLQPVGAGGGILVLNLMYPCFEPGARVGMDLSVRSGEDAFPVGTWKVGRPYTEPVYPLSGAHGRPQGLPLRSSFGGPSRPAQWNHWIDMDRDGGPPIC